MGTTIKVTLEIADHERTRRSVGEDPRTFAVLLRDVLSNGDANSVSSVMWTLENEYGVRVASTTIEYGK